MILSPFQMQLLLRKRSAIALLESITPFLRRGPFKWRNLRKRVIRIDKDVAMGDYACFIDGGTTQKGRTKSDNVSELMRKKTDAWRIASKLSSVSLRMLGLVLCVTQDVVWDTPSHSCAHEITTLHGIHNSTSSDLYRFCHRATPLRPSGLVFVVARTTTKTIFDSIIFDFSISRDGAYEGVSEGYSLER